MRAGADRAKFDATSATIAGRISAVPAPSRTDHPTISTVRFPASAVVSDPHPQITHPTAKARLRPRIWPSLPPVIMSEAITSV